ncbi:MAG: PAS domain-containing protein, partial [Pseudomonadota bacterium]
MAILSERIGPAARQLMWINAGLLTLMAAAALFLTISMKSHQSEAEQWDEAFALVAKTRFNTVQVQQFLTDYSLTHAAEAKAEATAARDAAVESLAQLGRLLPEKSTQAAGLGSQETTLFQVGERMAGAYIGQGKEAGDALMKGPGGFDEASASLARALEDLAGEILETQQRDAADLERLIFLAEWVLVGLAVLVAVTVLALLRAMTRNVLGQLGGEPADASQIVKTLAADQLDVSIPVAQGDDTSLLANLRTLQDRLRESRVRAVENLRIRIALDNVSANVMMADNERNIIYANRAVMAMFRNAQQDIRKDLPQFDAEGLLGANIDAFHKVPGHQARVLATFTGTYRSTLDIGGRTMTVVANPVLDEQGQRLGSVVEWADRTEEVSVEKAVAGLVEAAAAGDFSQRLDATGKDGFFRQLAEGIN